MKIQDNQTSSFVSFLIKTIPEIFGPKAQDNSLKALFENYKENGELKIGLSEPSKKDELIIQGLQLIKLGFPSEHLSISLRQYATQAWSFSVKSEEKGLVHFCLEWNNDLSRFSNHIKSPYIAPKVEILLQIHRPNYLSLKRKFYVESQSSSYVTDLNHSEIIWKKSSAIQKRNTFKVSLQKKENILKIHSIINPLLKGQKKEINLLIPVKIAFYI